MEGRERPQKGENCYRTEGKKITREGRRENYHRREGIATKGRTAMEGRELPQKGENCHRTEGKKITREGRELPQKGGNCHKRENCHGRERIATEGQKG